MEDDAISRRAVRFGERIADISADLCDIADDLEELRDETESDADSETLADIVCSLRDATAGPLHDAARSLRFGE